MAGISYSPARDKDVDFTDPVFDSTQVIMVKQGSSIKSGADLAGKVVGVNASTAIKATVAIKIIFFFIFLFSLKSKF